MVAKDIPPISLLAPESQLRRRRCRIFSLNKPTFVPLPSRGILADDELKTRTGNFHSEMVRRRTVRDFSVRPVPREVIESCLRTAGSTPSGANLQPWHFVMRP